MSFSVKVLFNKKLLNISADIPWVEKLCLCSHLIDRSEKVYEISITKDIVIITTEYATQDESGFATDNINAYDWDGNFLWNIADIVGDLKVPYFGGTVTTKELMRAHHDFDESCCDDSCELFCCSAGNRLYLIDLNDKKTVQVFETR